MRFKLLADSESQFFSNRTHLTACLRGGGPVFPGGYATPRATSSRAFTTPSGEGKQKSKGIPNHITPTKARKAFKIESMERSGSVGQRQKLI